LRVVAANLLRGTETLAEDLALAAASARMLRPDDVYILVPWSEKDVIDSCVNAFLRVPASLHLGPEPVLSRFRDAHIDRNGPIASLNLVRRPLTLTEVLQKRLFDIVVASMALILLAPLFVFIAMMIKLDSRGPVLFLQRRYGFNQQPFRIFKFRSMTTMEDGREVVQATAGDARITRVGRFIRRANLDELPQIINVLRGEMSLVGPRPHAMAHDQHFERTIALYARRHNVKPGITGWAQVNGLRGEITSPEIMRSRIEHDLYYIDNWSIWLDIWIICATILSPKAYRNAV
jgi:Undecaprenyl-phosphate glucose phosphotransferase